MAGFNLDFNDVYEGQGRIENGEYEVIIKSVKEDATPSGAEYVEFDLVIRNDFDQKHKNMHIFHKVWKAKDTGTYNLKTFNTMGKAFNLQNGKTYSSMQELMDDFRHKTARANVKTETNEYGGKSYENYKVFFNPTKTNACLHMWDEKDTPVATEFSEDNLPF